MLVGWRNHVTSGSGNNPKVFIFISCLCNQCHIPCCGIVFLVRQTVGIMKMCIFTSQLLCLLIHHTNKARLVTAHMLCHRIGTFICRFQHNTVEALFHGHLLIHISGNMGGIPLVLVNGIRRKGYHLIQLTVLQGNQRGHNLGNAGRIMNLVCVFLIENRSCVHLHYDGTGGRNVRLLGPVFFLRLYLHRTYLNGCQPT